MTARPTRADLAAEADRLRTANAILDHVVHYLARRVRPNAVELVREHDGTNTSYEAYDVCAAHGGIVVVTTYAPGSRQRITAHYLVVFASECRVTMHGRLDHVCAIQRLQGKAHALQRAAIEG